MMMTTIEDLNSAMLNREREVQQALRSRDAYDGVAREDAGQPKELRFRLPRIATPFVALRRAWGQ